LRDCLATTEKGSYTLSTFIDSTRKYHHIFGHHTSHLLLPIRGPIFTWCFAFVSALTMRENWFFDSCFLVLTDLPSTSPSSTSQTFCL
jgi:hypothetical protein